jgi:hypothetical protein
MRYDFSLQYIYQQLQQYPSTKRGNDVILKEKWDTFYVQRVNTYIQHIQQPENEKLAFLYTYLNGQFNNGYNKIVISE